MSSDGPKYTLCTTEQFSTGKICFCVWGNIGNQGWNENFFNKLDNVVDNNNKFIEYYNWGIKCFYYLPKGLISTLLDGGQRNPAVIWWEA